MYIFCVATTHDTTTTSTTTTTRGISHRKRNSRNRDALAREAARHGSEGTRSHQRRCARVMLRQELVRVEWWRRGDGGVETHRKFCVLHYSLAARAGKMSWKNVSLWVRWVCRTVFGRRRYCRNTSNRVFFRVEYLLIFFVNASRI